MRFYRLGLSAAACLLIAGCASTASIRSEGNYGRGQTTIVDTSRVAVAVGPNPGPAGEGYEDAVRRIEAYLDGLEGIGLQGAVLVEMEGREVFASGYGYADDDARLLNTPEIVFDIGSLTKQFTAAAILKLQMLNELDLADSLSRFFEYVPSDKAGITVHDLLRHRSGLPSTIGGDYDRISEPAFIAGVMNAPLRFQPGESFAYSNIGYSLLGLIVEKASGMSYESFLYEYLLKPAGLESTGYTRPGFREEQVAVGYHQNGDAWGRPTSKTWGDSAPFWHLTANGGLLSTVRDLYAWHRTLLQNTVLTEELTNLMYQPDLQDPEDDRHYYAYGWDVLHTRRHGRIAQHNGMNGYFYADFHRYLDMGMSVILLSNRMHPNFDRINSEIARIILEPGYTPHIPAEDNAANRQLSDDLIAVAVAQGLTSALVLWEERPSGVDVLEFVLRRRGFDLLDEGHPEAALTVFELNLRANPMSARAMQAMAEGYMEAGEPELAIRHFEACLAQEPENSFVLSMLERLRP